MSYAYFNLYIRKGYYKIEHFFKNKKNLLMAAYILLNHSL